MMLMHCLSHIHRKQVPMDKKFIYTIWSVVGIVLLGVIFPALVIKDNYIVYQIVGTTLLLIIFGANEYFKYMELAKMKNQISSSLDENNSELKENLEYQERLNSILYEVTVKLAEDPADERAVLDFILEKAIQAIPDGEYGSILTKSDQNLYVFAACYGYDFNALRSIKFKKEETFMWIGTGGNPTAPVIVRNIADFNRTRLNPETYQQHLDVVKFQAKSVISAPIYIDSQLYAILNIDSLKANAFTDNDLNLARFLTTHISFILKNRQLLEKAYYLSMFDKLTNIYNRTYFEDVFYDFQAKAFSHNKKFTLVLMDLNYLKKINDTYGHILGDTALKTFADGVKKHLNAGDVFARYGGDEFIALIDNVTTEKTKAKFEAIASYFEHVNIEYNGALIPVQFSYGIAEAPGESMILDILVKIADERMYDNKSYLKNRNLADPRFSLIR